MERPVTGDPSMGLPLVAPLRPEPRPTTSDSTPAVPEPLSKVPPLDLTRPQERVLDFDIETVAAGFADPDWVPQKITCVAWSWIGEDRVESRICGPEGIFGDPSRRRVMLEPLLQAIAESRRAHRTQHRPV